MPLVTTFRISAVSPHSCIYVFRYSAKPNTEYRPQQLYLSGLCEENGVFFMMYEIIFLISFRSDSYFKELLLNIRSGKCQLLE